MFVVKKSKHNPILIPDKNHYWEEFASFNLCPIKRGKTIYGLYRAISAVDVLQNPRQTSIIGIGESKSLNEMIIRVKNVLNGVVIWKYTTLSLLPFYFGNSSNTIPNSLRSRIKKLCCVCQPLGNLFGKFRMEKLCVWSVTKQKEKQPTEQFKNLKANPYF